MIELFAQTAINREIIDYLVDQNKKINKENSKVGKEIEKLREETARLKKEIEERRKRHPSSVEVKNGNPYKLKQDVQDIDSDDPIKQGAGTGHRGHLRRMSYITERITLKASEFSCPTCYSTPARKGFRKRVVKGTLPISPNVIQHRIYADIL